MSIQDRLERVLREIHILVSKGQTLESDSDYVVVSKKEILRQMASLSDLIVEMQDQYEITRQSRDKAEREASRKRDTILKDANHQAEDIYAASVIYSEDALGRIQEIIDDANKSVREMMHKFQHEMEHEKRMVRNNQTELKSQLENMKDTAKYIRIIEEKNRELSKARTDREDSRKIRSQEWTRRTTNDRPEEDPDFVPVKAEIRINEEYFEKAGIAHPKDEAAETPEQEPEIRYEKPEIRINPEYFEKAGIPMEKDVKEDAESDQPDESEKSSVDEHSLMDELDLEYFEWKDETEDSRQLPRVKRKDKKFTFGLGRKDKE